MFKRLRIFALIPVVLLSLVAVAIAAAPRTGSWTETNARYGDGWRITTYLWAADSTGVVETKVTDTFFRGLIKAVVTDPDTTTVPADADSTGQAPSDNYDITLTNTDGLEIMGGSLSNRDTANTEWRAPVAIVPGTLDTLMIELFNNSKLSIAVSGNDIPNARGYIKIFWQEK